MDSPIALIEAVIVSLLIGLIVALVTYVIIWLVSLVITINEPYRRQVAVAVGVLVALLSLLGYFT